MFCLREGDRMKRCLFCLIPALLLASCGTEEKSGSPQISFTTMQDENYLALTHDGRIYVPFCAGSKSLMGACIGNYSADGSETNLVYVYAVKGQSPEEWLMDAANGNCSESMLYREQSVTDYPEGFAYEPEYWWNDPEKSP